MNLSIIVPGTCNMSCKFCFWKQKKACNEYISALQGTLDTVPSDKCSLSITGGEPTISDYLPEILKCIRRRKEKFTKVVLTTNGTCLEKAIPYFIKTVDHVNVSRHHYDCQKAADIFGIHKVRLPQINIACEQLNMIGIDVTLNAVHDDDRMRLSPDDVIRFIEYAKTVGASAIAFRKVHSKNSTTAPTKIENLYRTEYKIVSETSCPVCRSSTMLIQGMPVTWKTSTFEPSKELNEVYEVVFHPNGELTADWDGEMPVDVNTLSLVSSPDCLMHKILEATPLRQQEYLDSIGCADRYWRWRDESRRGCGYNFDRRAC